MPDLSSKIEAADRTVARAAAPAGRGATGWLADTIGRLGDQPPLRLLGIGVLGIAAWRSDGRLAAAAARMLAAHSLATVTKTQIKRRIDRTRPDQLIEHGRYRAEPGDHDRPEMNSFPSGHTAGAVAMAAAAARAYPSAGPAAGGAAATLALLQIPRRAHFVSDTDHVMACHLIAARKPNGA